MAEFARYYITFLTNLFSNIGVFFRDIGLAIANIFVLDLPQYVNEFSSSVAEFGVGGWIVFLLVTLINVTCLFFVSYRLVQLIRRYIIFRAKEVEKDKLVEELAKTKDKVAKLTIEKNQLYAMKINAMYPITAEGESSVNSSSKEEEVKLLPSARFKKLAAIDKKYEVISPYISTAEADDLQLDKIVDYFVNFSASQLKLYYKKEIVRCFFAGMATTKVLILEGISGTGKTSLPYAVGKFFNNDATLISVQPSWRDRGDLVGYLNEFTKTFNETEFLGALYEANYQPNPSVIVLDEMNLARIEYYFAEFLSVMEMPDSNEWTIDLVPSADENDPIRLDDGKILVPQSIWFVGTANQDDSTFTITDKVYDRTITIDLNNRGEYFDAPVTPSMNVAAEYLQVLFDKAQVNYPVTEKTIENLRAIDTYILDKFKITFGNRIMKQFKAFIPVYVAAGGKEMEALDFLLMSKIFRKFKALNLPFLQKELNGLIALLDKLFGKGNCPVSVEYIKSLLRSA